MRLASRMMVLSWALRAFGQEVRPRRFAYQARQAGGQPSARWIGQDGHDYVGASNRLEPSEVQDVISPSSGLDPQKEIEYIDVTTERPDDQWEYNAQSFSWKAELKRAKGSRTADLFLEPGHNDSIQNYRILIRYEGGATRELAVRSRKVNRGLRMPGAAVQARWAGQDRQDRVGDGPSVGPDGVQDSRIRLSGVSTKIGVKAMRIEATGGAKWESGANPQLLSNAEYWPDPKKPGEGDLFFQPGRDLKGQKLNVRVLYANETMDSAAVAVGKSDPKLRMPEQPLPRLAEVSASARWRGQDGQDVTGPGDVHVTVTGLGRTQGIAGAVLTDSVRGTWIYRSGDRIKGGEPTGDATGPLVLKPGPDRTSIELFFAPYRDEAKATMTLRLIEQDGRMTVARFPGGACDPGRRSASPATTRVEARPGDDLNSLARQHGTVSLAPGTYRLDRPLVLEKPVTLTSEGKATLVFTQASGEPPWTAAIKIHCGHTTLNGFAVRLEGPIRWDQEVSYGPALIGTTDNRDQGHDDPKFDVSITRLDLEIPPPADTSKWVEAMRLIRLTNARGGMIAGNVLRGGVVEFFGGPWQVLNNDYRGTPPGTYSHSVFTGHGTFDLTLKGNRAKPAEPAGKTWRFLVLTHQGTNDRVLENIVEDLGSREGDTIPWANAPEIILTEAYHLTYEGKLAALSGDGRCSDPSSAGAAGRYGGRCLAAERPGRGAVPQDRPGDRPDDLSRGRPDPQGYRRRLDRTRFCRRSFRREPDRHARGQDVGRDGAGREPLRHEGAEESYPGRGPRPAVHGLSDRDAGRLGLVARPVPRCGHRGQCAGRRREGEPPGPRAFGQGHQVGEGADLHDGRIQPQRHPLVGNVSQAASRLRVAVTPSRIDSRLCPLARSGGARREGFRKSS